MGVSTLIFKTTMILGVQLLILLYCAACWVAQSPGPCFSRVATLKKTPGGGLVSYSAFDKIVMDCGQSKKRRWAVTLGFVSGYLMASMLSKQDLLLGLFGMTLLSVAAAPLLGQMMIDADRGDGKRALKIVILSVGVLGLFGLQYPSDVSVPWVIIAACLGILFLSLGLVARMRLCSASRLSGVVGLLIFQGIVLSPFQGLAALEGLEGNAWRDALEMAVALYFKVWPTMPLVSE